MADEVQYLSGFGNYVQSEALAGALPRSQNSPKPASLGLYAEQVSGSPFTSKRGENLHSWLYRILPSTLHSEFSPYPHDTMNTALVSRLAPTQLRWRAFDYLTERTDFIGGLLAIAGMEGAVHRSGAMLYVYRINTSMIKEYFYDADAELLFIPEQGALRLLTEFGVLDISPGEISVIPRGIKFQVQLLEDTARGYLCENFGIPLQLPELGPLGANALASPRHFQLPCASFQDVQDDMRLIAKFSGNLWQCEMKHSPLNVVAWHGNYVPYKYNLKYFNTINTVSFDHPDPSIFTVLTSPSAVAGQANLDFTIFPHRWMVAEHTFRPPYYHRNTMSELMGLIYGHYDSRDKGFEPGGISIHNCMTPHGPDAQCFTKAMEGGDEPQKSGESLAFLLESHQLWRPTEHALQCEERDKAYLQVWQDLPRHFQSG